MPPKTKPVEFVILIDKVEVKVDINCLVLSREWGNGSP